MPVLDTNVDIQGPVDAATSPVFYKRKVKAGRYAQSPYSIRFGSAGLEKVFEHRRGMCPIDDKLGDIKGFVFDIEFENWLECGLRPRNK